MDIYLIFKFEKWWTYVCFFKLNFISLMHIIMPTRVKTKMLNLKLGAYESNQFRTVIYEGD